MRWGIASVLIPMFFGVVFANEAEDTGRTLTPEQAQEAIEYENDSLSFDNVTSLTPEVAAILAKHEGKSLSLPDLKTLAPDTAAALSAYKGELALRGLKMLSAATAEALAKHEGRLDLEGIPSLPEDAALALAKHKGDLVMRGLVELHCEPLARQLLLADDGFSLNQESLTAISPEVAELLVISSNNSFHGWDTLRLPELKHPSLDVLRVLSRCRSGLEIGVQALTPEMATILVKHDVGGLAVAVNDVDALRILMTFEGGLQLDIAEATPEIASILSTFKGHIQLPWRKLPIEVEHILAGSETAYFKVNPVEIQTREFAAKLIESHMQRYPQLEDPDPWYWRASGIEWQQLKDLSPDVAKELAVFPGLMVLQSVEKVSPDAADALASCKGQLVLPGLKELTNVSLAKKLAESATAGEVIGESRPAIRVDAYKGLRLPHVTQINPDVAHALACHKGEYLALNGLTAITDEVAEALAHFSGELSLGAITEMTARSERLLGQGDCKYIWLPNIRRLEEPSLARKALMRGTLESVSVDALQALVDRNPRDLPQESYHSYARDSMSLELPELTPEQAAVLATRHGDYNDIIFLDAVKQLDAGTAGELARAKLSVSLCGLRELTPVVAAALANHPGAIYLRGVEAVPVEVAQALAKKTTGTIFFDGRYSWKSKDEPFLLPEESAVLLRNHPHVKLPSYLRRP